MHTNKAMDKNFFIIVYLLNSCILTDVPPVMHILLA